MKIKGGSYILVVTIAFTLLVVISALTMENWKSKLLPLVLSGIILVLAAVELRRNILAGDATAATTESTTDETGEGRESLRGYLLTGAWVVGFLLAVYLLGFIIAIPLFILPYMKLHGSRWLSSIITTVLTSIFIYGLFEVLLNITLYRGLVLTSLG